MQLARAFSQQLTSALSPDEYRQVIERNEAETNPNVCHSHDFTDANQCMLDALTALGLTFDPQDAAQASLIAQAWDIAKACEFDPNEIDNLNQLGQ